MTWIQVKETTVVRPAAATPHITLWLSNLDALFPTKYHALTATFFSFNGDGNFFDSRVLKVALSRALVHFYPVAGRLKKNGKRLEIECNGEGVLFVHAEFNGCMDELGDFSPRHDLSFAPAVDYSRGISTYPLFMVQITRFKCGGVGLGMAVEHHLADGISAQHFINTWSDIARGREISVPPFLDRRAVLSARNPPQPMFTHIEYQPPPSMKNPPNNEDLLTNSLTIYKKFKLTRDQLNTLKVKCDGNDGTNNYTRFEVVAGHGWRSITKARGLPDDQLTKMHVVVDGRSRLKPPLPQGYFGNASFAATPIATAGELLSEPLAFSVGKVHDAIARVDNEYAKSALDYLELHQDDLSGLARGPSTCKCPNLIVNGWNRLPLYDMDFGWGRPVHFGHGTVPFEGKTFVMASTVNDGSLWYAVALPEDHIRRFEKAFYEEFEGVQGAGSME